jgi:hypothetical protein
VRRAPRRHRAALFLRIADRMRLDELKAEDFETLRGSTVMLRQPTLAVPLEVTEVKRLRSHRLRPQPPFAVILRGPRTAPLGQGIHRIEHPQHGALDVFIVPLGPDGGGFGYEITFN